MTSRLSFTSVLTVVIATVMVGAAAGQVPTTPLVAPQIVDPKACAPQERLRPTEGTAPQLGTTQALSEKLERTEGVICPPLGIDPEIVEPPPGGGKTPIIPPPGSPGGDPTIRPK
jgi:hypothetical protein